MARTPGKQRGRRGRRPLFLNRITRDDRGVAAVEAAIITPVFLLLVFGIIEFGLVFKDQLAITSAVRAGARIASAEPRTATLAEDAASQVAREGSAIDMTDVKSLWVYQADSTGHPEGAGGSFDSCATNCVQFTWNVSSKSFVATAGSWDATAQNACQGTQDNVGVYLSFNHPGVTQAFFNSIGLSSYTVMRFEPIPTLQAGGCK
jgi:Flp pilus assembly protein TadG